MNAKEKIVLIFLVAVFLTGAGINIYKRTILYRRLASISVELTRPIDSLKRVVIDINNATKEELDFLPGIGPVLAQRIISYREEHKGFNTVTELLNVPGIGPKRFSAIKNWVTCGKFQPRYSEEDTW